MRNAELFQEELEGIEALILEHPTSKTFKRRQYLPPDDKLSFPLKETEATFPNNSH